MLLLSSFIVRDGSVGKDLSIMQETQEMWVRSPEWEDPLEEETATHSSILVQRIPWTAWWATAHRVAKSQTRLSDGAPTH